MRASTGKILACTALLALPPGALIAYVAAQPSDPVIPVVARRFSYSPNEITLKRGVPVILEFTTTDVVMGFNLPDFNTRADIVPGQKTRVRLVPDKVGTFPFACDIFCGSGHESMDGRVVVTE